jgi:hypothetical protein
LTFPVFSQINARVQPGYDLADIPAVSVHAPLAPVDPISLLDAEETERIRRLERKRIHDAERRLEGWERYRALIDASDEAYELIDISNREARFALILMGALNAVALVLVTRADALSILPSRDRYWMVALFVAYIVMAVGFLLQAIEALRPGRFRPRLWDWTGGDDDRPAGVRYYEDVIEQTAAGHWKAWQDVRLTQLNAEIAVQVHSLSLKNHAKHVAIRRLYGGLRIMAMVLGALMIVFAWLVWTQPEPLRTVPAHQEPTHKTAPVPVPSMPTFP